MLQLPSFRSVWAIGVLLLGSGCVHEQQRPTEQDRKVGLVFGFDHAHVGENRLRIGVFDVENGKLVAANDKALEVTVVLKSPSGATKEPFTAGLDAEGPAVANGAGARFNYSFVARLNEPGKWLANVSVKTPWSPQPTAMPYAFDVR
jgi:hypothetical protein